MKINREDVVQAALVLERWCRTGADCTNCPFFQGSKNPCVLDKEVPEAWGLEEKLRKRGLKDV